MAGTGGWRMLVGSAEAQGAGSVTGLNVCCWSERSDGMFHIDIGKFLLASLLC